MAFPVDILTNVDLESLEEAAKKYMSQLPYRNPEYLSLPGSKQIEIGLCNVSYVPLYGEDTKKKLLALFSPDDSKTVVGLYLLGQWWGVEDVLKTAEPLRTGLIKVSTLGERIVLYVLNRIVLRTEKSNEDVSFLCHCEHESAKILWKDGEAIGFYSFKPKGSLCRIFLTHCYQLPVMDTVFVRKCHRGKGHGMQILEDFVGSFRKENIGLKFPLSEAMYKVCEKYLSIYPADKELLWEVEKIGSPFQRTLIAKRLQKLKLKEKVQVVSKLNFEKDDATAPMETEITKIQETTEYTEEISEEIITDFTKEVDDTPVTRSGRGSNLKRRGIRENLEERLNIIRVEHIEAGVESPIEVAIEENLDNRFSVKESESVLRSTTDTVTATVIRISELRDSQKEEEQEIGKDIITATAISEGTPVTHATTAGEIKSQRSSEDECEMVKEHTVEIQGATIGSIGQSQLQSVVNIEIVMMSTGTEEEQHETLENNTDVEKDETVCETERGEINQMLGEPEGEKTVSETPEEVADQPQIHAELTEEEQAHWDVEITEKKERSEDEVMEECEKDLPEENSDDNIGAKKSESEDEYTVLLQSVEIEDQTKMVLCTEEVLCDQRKQNEAETEVSEPNQTETNKDTLIEEAKKNKLGPDGPEQIFTQSKLSQKRTSALTPSRKSKRLRHQPVETYLRTTKTVKTTQQRSKHLSKAMMQKEDTEQSTDKPEHDGSEVMEKSSVEKKAESEVEEYKEYEKLTVETVSTMDHEIIQVEETADVVPDVSELVERAEIDLEEVPQQPSVEPTEVQELRTTPEKDEETVENNTITLTLSEAKVVLVDLHKLPSEEAGDNHGEMDVGEQDGIKQGVSFKQQVPEETMKMDRQDGTMDTKPMEEPACITATKDVAADDNITREQSAELETTDVVLESQVEKTDTEQAIDKQDKQTQKKGLTDTPCEMPNTNVDETAAVAPGSSELLKATETDDKEKEPQITEATKEDIPLVEAEPDNVTEKGVEKIRTMEKKETNLTRQTHSDAEMSSLAQEKDVQEQEAPVSTERSLRRRTIRVQSPPRKKAKHGGKVDVGHQERITAESKNKTKTISMTEERVEEMDQDVKKIENNKANLAEPAEEPDMSTNDYEKTVNVCIPISTTETSMEGLDETADTNVKETAAVDTKGSEQLMGIEKYDQEKEFQIIKVSEEGDSLVEAEEVEKEDGAPVIKLQKATIVLVDLNQLSQNTEEECITPEVLTLSQMEDQQNIDGPNKSEQELLNLSSEEEILEEEAPVSTERSLRRRTIKVHSPPRRKSRRVQKQESEAFEDKNGKKVPITGTGIERMHKESAKLDDKEETPQKSAVIATEKVIALVETEPEECIAEKVVEEINKIENKETNLVVSKHTDKEAPEIEEKASSELQENELLVGNDKVTAETEKPMEMDEDPVIGKDQQPYVVEGTTIQIEEKVSQVESTEANQSDHEGITRKSLRLSAKAVTSTQKTRKSTRLHKEQYVLVTEADMSRNEYDENSGTLEETPIITVETTLESPNEISNTNVEETPAVEPETSELLMGAEIDDKVEEIVEEVPPEKAEPEEKVEKDDSTPVIEVQKTTVVFIDLNKRSHNTAGESDKAEVLKHSQTEENLEQEEEEKQEPQKEKDLEGQNDVRETEIVEEYNVVKDEEAVKSGEHQEGAKVKVMLRTSTVEVTEEEIPILEAEPLEKTDSLDNEVTPEMRRKESNSEQQENQPLVENEKESAQTEKPMEMDEDPVVSKEQTHVIEEETAIQVEGEVPQTESSETNENKGEKIIRRSLRISAQSVTPTQKNRQSTQLYTAELELVKEANMSRNEETSSTVAETVNVYVPIITAETNVTQGGNIVSMSKVEAASDKQEIDISKALPDISTDKEEDEPESSVKTTEKEILVEMDKKQKGLEEGVQGEENAEPSQKNTDQEQKENILDEGEDEIRASPVEEDTTQQDEAVSQEENVGENNPTNEFKITAVALERSEQEAPFITRSLRSRTVTVQATPTRKSKRLHRQEVEPEKETKDYIYGNENDSVIPQQADDLNIPIGKENEALNTEESTAKFENMETKEQEDIIQVNTDGDAKKTGTKDDTVAKGNEILFEIMESNSASLENTELNKTHEDNLEKEDVQVPKEQVEEEVSSVYAEEIENERAAGVPGSSSDLEETVERRTLRKRTTVEAAAPRKSKRLCKHECDENSKQVRESVMEQTESIEVTFTADNVELSSDVPAAVFEGSHLGEEILQEIQKAAEGTQSDYDIFTETDAGVSQEKQKGDRVDQTQTQEDNKEENSKLVEETDEIEEVIEQHEETEEQHLESSANDCFILELETEDNYSQEENEANKESRVTMEAEKSEEGEENMSEDDEKGIAIEKHVLQISSGTASTRRKSMRLQMHESKKTPKEDESDSEDSEAQQTAKQRRQRKRKAITDSTPARRSKRHVRANIV